jgi:hypothetical protein
MTELGMLTDELANEAMARAIALEASQGQSGINGGHGWQRVFLAVASACDEVKALLVKKAEECGVEIALPVLDGFGPMRTYLGRASYVENMGGVISSDIAPGADAFWAACDRIGVPSDTLPPRDRGTWVESWEALGPTGRAHMFMALLARGLLDIVGVVSSWRGVPVEAAPKRKRA